MVWLGLDDADKLGSVVGAFSGVIGVGLSIVGIVLARRSTPNPSAQPPSVAPPGQSVINSQIDGPNIQIGSAGGNVEIHRES
jgi:hypothetical protein